MRMARPKSSPALSAPVCPPEMIVRMFRLGRCPEFLLEREWSSRGNCFSADSDFGELVTQKAHQECRWTGLGQIGDAFALDPILELRFGVGCGQGGVGWAGASLQ